MKPGEKPNLSGSRSDLSRLRHELRTPINHILGYSEMLLEDDQLPPAMVPDLRRVHAGGQRLQVLIGEYFSDDASARPQDMHRLYHELRTPVNQIVGYSELLQELSHELSFPTAVADLQKIREAATHWLALAESHLVQPPGPANVGTPPSAGAEPRSKEDRQAPSPAEAATAPPHAGPSTIAERAGENSLGQGTILIVDDDETNRDMLARRLRRQGYGVAVAVTGEEALQLAAQQTFDLILLDMILPGMDGVQVLSRLKADAHLREIPVIMLSALDNEMGIARCIEMGAEDYLSKPFKPVFLWARLGASLERKRLRDRERAAFHALQRSERHLAAELAEAAAYVRSLLPAPLTGPLETDWCFQPGAQLGGDAFGYHWLDDDHFAIYLLDVCGHGVGAALLSVSVLNTLRAQTLPEIDFRQPSSVLAALNRTFQMERQNQLYFTIWFGVYRRASRELFFASGGHPPAVLLPAPPAAAAGAATGIGAGGGFTPAYVELRRSAPAIGCLDEAVYTEGSQVVPPGSRLLLLSDGVFEIPRPDGRTGNWAEFVAGFASPEFAALRPAGHLKRAQDASGPTGLEDDFSMVELVLH